MKRREGPNIGLSASEMFMYKNDLVSTQQVFTDFDKTVKIGDEEYCISDADSVANWKKS